MKSRLFSVLVLTLVFSIIASPVLAYDLNHTDTPPAALAEHVPGELLIRFSPSLDSTQRAAKMSDLGVSPKREIPHLGVSLV